MSYMKMYYINVVNYNGLWPRAVLVVNVCAISLCLANVVHCSELLRYHKPVWQKPKTFYQYFILHGIYNTGIKQRFVQYDFLISAIFGICLLLRLHCYEENNKGKRNMCYRICSNISHVSYLPIACSIVALAILGLVQYYQATASVQFISIHCVYMYI